MRSRANYLKELERQVNASTNVIDDLIKENYELRELLREAIKDDRSNRKPRDTQVT